MISRALSPRGLGWLAAGLALLVAVLVVVGLPGAAMLSRHGAHLGETGLRFVTNAVILAVPWLLFLSVAAVILLDVRQAQARLDRRYDTWRPFFALGGVVALLCLIEASLFFLKSYLLILGPAGPYYLDGRWMGIPVLIPSEPFALNDYFTSLFLLLGAASAGSSWWQLLAGRLRVGHPPHLFLIFAVGLTYLAMDEYLTIHEFLGANLPILKDSQLAAHPDDLVMVAYFAAALLLFARYLPLFWSDKVLLACLGLGVFLQGIAAIGDAVFPLNLAWVEELAEVGAAGTYLLFVSRCGQPRGKQLD